VKLFRKKRLQIQEEESKTSIRWWRMDMLDLILLFILPMHVIYGIASATNAEEIFGLRVLSMSTLTGSIYWTLALLMILHLFFNRIMCLVISTENIHYTNGKFPPLSRTFPMHAISNVEVKEKEDPIAEAPAGWSLTNHTLYINSASGKRIRIKGISQKDALFIRYMVISYRGA
jgi:hypothetical protein